MLAFPTDFETQLLRLIWSSAFILAALSSSMLMGLCVFRHRRILQERERAQRSKKIEKSLSAILVKNIRADKSMLPNLSKRDIPALVDVLLSFFRSIAGKRLSFLRDALEQWDVEPLIIRAATRGHRSHRIQALTVLSYLTTPTSLETIRHSVRTRDEYVRLAAMRAAGRRKAQSLLPDIIESIEESDIRNPIAVTDILVRFGPQALESMEQLAAKDLPIELRIGAFEAMSILEPEHISLNLDELYEQAPPKLQVSILKLCGKLGSSYPARLVTEGLTSSHPDIRIAALNAASLVKKREFLPGIMKAVNDESWLVRIKAAEAMLEYGHTGSVLLRSLKTPSVTDGHEETHLSVAGGSR